MAILVNSWLKPARFDDCTEANSILTESRGCGEVENVIFLSVQITYKLLRDTKPIHLHRRVAPPMEILGKSPPGAIIALTQTV